jgi:glutamine cyclotransferase
LPLLVLIVTGLSIICCKSEQSSTTSNLQKANRIVQKDFKVQTPETSGNYVLSFGDPVQVELSRITDTVVFNSVYFYSGSNAVDSVFDLQQSYSVTPFAQTVGRQQLKAVVNYNDTLSESHFLSYTYFSNITPNELSYKVVRKIPHDTRAYVQGLLFHDGFLYEGTGHRGESSLRKIDPESGKIVKNVNLDHKYFGEGIALHNGTIFQVTWQSQTAFIYNPEDLSLIDKIFYDFREGWGLTSDGTQLLMSDGSAKIYYLEPEMLTELKRTEIYDDQGMIPRINELEYVQGKLFANVYGKKHIVVIDPETGKVLSKLDLTMLFPEDIPDNMDHVLNGIAYDSGNNRFYVTGKYWPVMYELEITGW